MYTCLFIASNWSDVAQHNDRTFDTYKTSTAHVAHHRGNPRQVSYRETRSCPTYRQTEMLESGGLTLRPTKGLQWFVPAAAAVYTLSCFYCQHVCGVCHHEMERNALKARHALSVNYPCWPTSSILKTQYMPRYALIVAFPDEGTAVRSVCSFMQTFRIPDYVSFILRLVSILLAAHHLTISTYSSICI